MSIKLIVFDLDGTLIDSAKLHFDAYNLALAKNGYSPISWEDHVGKFDGVPGHEKLKAVGVDNVARVLTDKSGHFHKLAKNHNFDLPNIIDCLQKLRQDGYLLYIASNADIATLDTVFIHSRFSEFIDKSFCVSDIAWPKPNPQIYLKCMYEAGIGPWETLIVEDSNVGIIAAVASGARVVQIKNPFELNYNLIMEEIKPKW